MPKGSLHLQTSRRPLSSNAERGIIFKCREGNRSSNAKRASIYANAKRAIASSNAKRVIASTNVKKAINFERREGHHLQNAKRAIASSNARRVIIYANAKRVITSSNAKRAIYLQTLREPSSTNAEKTTIFERWEGHHYQTSRGPYIFKCQKGHYIFKCQEGHCIFKRREGYHLQPPRGPYHLQTPRGPSSTEAERAIVSFITKRAIAYSNHREGNPYYIIKGDNIIAEWINIILSIDHRHRMNRASTTSSHHWINIILPMNHQCRNIILSIKHQHLHHQCSNIILSMKYHHQHYCIIEKVIIIIASYQIHHLLHQNRRRLTSEHLEKRNVLNKVRTTSNRMQHNVQIFLSSELGHNPKRSIRLLGRELRKDFHHNQTTPLLEVMWVFIWVYRFLFRIRNFFHFYRR
ncbi:hypothetical protein KY290_007889 [Solanum tuberosum]|uniref:Uncharacterized protein n=1 Tax=Solanum tuberosum TaxID=4113 RepID=A0ABQ7W6Y5_SOLTU|nr:hypothetical protein KY290_007889 [Solanum tuberosum]